MSKAEVPNRVKLIASIFFNDPGKFLKAKNALKRIFGDTDFESDILDFVHTDYYHEEFGKDLKRQMLSFKKLISLKNIYKVKLRTSALERKFSKLGKRTVNIDPGYIDLSKLVLFSTKDYSHRIYLDNGIFSEVTLFYKDKSFNGWPWTYPDYGSKAYIDIFNSVRQIYRDQLN